MALMFLSNIVSIGCHKKYVKRPNIVVNCNYTGKPPANPHWSLPGFLLSISEDLFKLNTLFIDFK